jgi:pilus assembly protein CpaB
MRVAQIAVLGVAVIAGGIAAFLAYRSPEPIAAPPPPPVPIATVKILVAAKDIGLGQVINAQDMKWISWPSASQSSQDVLETAEPKAIEKYQGWMAKVPIQHDWPVWESNLIDAKLKVSSAGYVAAKLPPGKRALSIDISAETGAGGSILPNDHVDVIHTYRDRVQEKLVGGETWVSEMLLANIPVVAIDQTFEEKNGVQTQVGKTATLIVTPSEAADLSRARMEGRLSLSLRSLSENESSPVAVARRAPVDPVVPAPPPARAAPPPERAVDVCRPLLCEHQRFRLDDGEASDQSASN